MVATEAGKRIVERPTMQFEGRGRRTIVGFRIIEIRLPAILPVEIERYIEGIVTLRHGTGDTNLEVIGGNCFRGRCRDRFSIDRAG